MALQQSSLRRCGTTFPRAEPLAQTVCDRSLAEDRNESGGRKRKQEEWRKETGKLCTKGTAKVQPIKLNSIKSSKLGLELITTKCHSANDLPYLAGDPLACP